MELYIGIAVVIAVALFFAMLNKAVKLNKQIQLIKFLFGAVCLGALWPLFAIIVFIELLAGGPKK